MPAGLSEFGKGGKMNKGVMGVVVSRSIHGSAHTEAVVRKGEKLSDPN